MKDHKKELATIVAKTPNLPRAIKNDAEYEAGREIYVAIKDRQKQIAERKAKIVDPLNTAMKETKALFKPFEDQLDKLAVEAKIQLEAYLNKREEKAQKALEAVGNIKGNLDDTIKKLEKVQEKFARLDGTRTLKQLVIFDAKKIPEDYWMINEPALKAALMLGKDIPGAKLEDVLIVSA